MEFLYEYGLFLAKAVTFVLAIAAIVGLIASAAHKPKSKKGELEIDDISAELKELKERFLQGTLSKEALKAHNKQSKKQAKNGKNVDDSQPKLYVLDFKGSVDANEVGALREEVTAILTIAEPSKDEVLIRLESGGGVVHGYGLAASQLQRIKNAGFKLTVCVDKVAASGGYMMACVADKLVCAPFAILGSIGVIAQLPNFNKVLKKHDIEFEQLTAGEYKRTLTVFGENTEKGRDKFKEDLEQIHGLFKTFVSGHRTHLDIDKVATGETWFGSQALEQGLVDKVSTSDDILLAENAQKQIYKVKYSKKKPLAEKFAVGASQAISQVLVKLTSNFKSLAP